MWAPMLASPPKLASTSVCLCVFWARECSFNDRNMNKYVSGGYFWLLVFINNLNNFDDIQVRLACG